MLVPGAGGSAWYWHLLVAELERRGHRAVAVDIREDDPALGLADYADTVRTAMGGHDRVVLVAQSLGGFTAPVVAQDPAVRMIVLLNAMIPLPGETPGQWWDATGHGAARAENDRRAGRNTTFDERTHFLHDVPDQVAAAGARHQRAPSETPFGQPCDFARWPDVPITVLVGRDDRFLPAGFQRRVALQRLGLGTDELTGGHLVALSNPVQLADHLVAHAAEAVSPA